MKSDEIEANRCSKREIITISDDDSDSEQPIAKSAKREAEPASSAKVRQNGPKLDENLPQDDSQSVVIDGSKKDREEELEEKLAAVRKQLEGVRRRAENAFQSKLDLVRENRALKNEMAEMRREANTRSRALESSQKKAAELVDKEKLHESELARENRTLRTEIAQIRKDANARDQARESAKQKTDVNVEQLLAKVNVLTSLLEAERRRAVEERVRDRTRIDELRADELYQLAQNEGWLQPVQQHPLMQQSYPMLQSHMPPPYLQQQQYPVMQPPPNFSVPPPLLPPMPANAAPACAHPGLHETCHPTNIFLIYRLNTPGSISIDNALYQLRAQYVLPSTKEAFRRYADFSDVKITCELCLLMPRKSFILDHFLSYNHVNKVRERGGFVSLAALEYWLRKLQQATEAAAASAVRPVQQSAADATSGGGGAKGDMKKEVE